MTPSPFRAEPSRAEPSRAEPSLRAWLEWIAQMAIDWLDQLDRAGDELEDDEREIACEDEVVQ